MAAATAVVTAVCWAVRVVAAMAEVRVVVRVVAWAAARAVVAGAGASVAMMAA